MQLGARILRRTGDSVLLSGIRWRLGASILTVVISAIAVGAAVLGPLYLRAAGDSVVRDAVQQAPPESLGVTLLVSSGEVVTPARMTAAEQTVEKSGDGRWYGNPLTTVTSGLSLHAPDGSPLLSALLFRSGICSVLSFRQGGCPGAPGQVVVSDRTAAELGVSVGSVLTAGVRGGSGPLALKVAGVYAVPDLTLGYWWGEGPGYFPFGVPVGPGRTPQVDPLITTEATADSVPVQDVPALTGQVPFLSGRVNLGDQAAVLRALSAATQGLEGSGVTISSQLPGILADAGHERHAMSTIVAVGAVQLVVLSIWVLAGQAARTGDARRDEVRVARLRGFPLSSLLWASAAEPTLLCAAGIPLGVVGAWAAITAARDHLLNPRAAVTTDGWEVVAFASTVAAIAATVGLGVWRSLRTSRLSPGSGRPDSRWLGLTGDAVLLVLSVVAVVDLTISGALAGRTDPIAALAPALIGLGVAVVATHLLLAACRFAIKRTDYSAWTASFLAVRQVARRQGTLRQARALVIASCLACFGVAAWSVARSNRHTVAGFTVGASTVATVVPESTTLHSAVDRVDPAGRFAMAAQVIVTASSTVLAVDSSRLARTVVWPARLSNSSARAAARALVAGSAPEVVLPSGSVRVSAIATGPAPVPPGQVHLGLWVFNPGAGTSIIDLGPLRAGSAVYSASDVAACPGGCRLGGLSLIPAVGSQPSGSTPVEVTVTGLVSEPPGGARSTAADLSGRAWQSSGVGVELAATSGGLRLRASLDAIARYEGAVGAVTPPMAAPVDHPELIPAVVTSEVKLINGGASSSSSVPVLGFDGNTVDVEPVVTVPAIPGMGTDAVLVDMDTLGRLQTGPTLPTVTDQVWLGPASPADVLERLEQAGLHVEGVQRASMLDSQYEHTGSALADDFFLLATIAALLVAGVSTLAVVGSSFRPRATELAALELSGVRRKVIARSLGIESAILGTTVLFGAAAGAAASSLALRSLPELASSASIPLPYSVPAGPILIVGAISLLIVLGAAATAAILLLRDTSPALVRQIPDDIAA